MPDAYCIYQRKVMASWMCCIFPEIQMRFFLSNVLSHEKYRWQWYVETFPLQRTEPWKISVTVICGNCTSPTYWAMKNIGDSDMWKLYLSNVLSHEKYRWQWYVETLPLQRTEPWKISVTVICGNFTAHAACYRTVKKKGRIRVACRMTAACMSVCVLVCMFVTFTPIVTNFTIWREMWRDRQSAESHYINVPSHVRCEMYGVWFWGYLMVSSTACWRRTYTKFTLIFIGLHWIVLWRML